MKRAWSAKNLWERSPAWVKTVAGSALRAVPLPLILGARFRRRYQLVLNAQRWSAERIRGWQIEHLRRVLTLAQDRSPFYQQAFQEAGFDARELRSPEDIRVLPTIDKQTLLDHVGDMMTQPPSAPGADYVTTGGTSGTPLSFTINADRSAIEYAHLTAAWARVGFAPGDTLAVFRGRVVEEDRRGLRHHFDPLLRQHFYGNFHMTEDNMRRYLDHVRTIGPCFLHVYPSSVDALARFVRRTQTPPPSNIRGIIAESEIVYPDQRARAEEAFACRYFSCYGHTEKLVLAAECEHSTDAHVDPLYGFCELLDDEGRPITTPGQEGEIVGTGFINTVVPFIRYRTGDRAVYVGQRCGACGREHLLLRDIAGHRTQEMLVAADGSRISWTAVNMHDDTFDRVRRFQFHQRHAGHAVLRIVPATGFGEADLTRIRRHLAVKLEGRLTFDAEICDDIPLTGRGKATYVLQELDDDSCASMLSTSSRSS